MQDRTDETELVPPVTDGGLAGGAGVCLFPDRMNVQQPLTALEQHVVAEKKHSGLGVTSFIMSIVTGFVMFVVVGTAGYLEMSTPGGLNEESPAAVLVGLGVIGTGLLVLLGLGLGIGALFQTDRKKTFAILGVTINGVIIAGTVGLMVIGSLAE